MKRKMSLSVRMYLAMLLLFTGQSALAEEYLYTQAFAGPEYGRYHIEVLHAAIRKTIMVPLHSPPSLFPYRKTVKYKR